MSPQRIEAHLDMLLGNPKEGLIEAVKTLIAERDELRTKNAEQVLMVEAEWKVSAEVDARYEDARAEIERLRVELGHLRKHVQHNDEEYKTMKDVLRSVHGVYQAALVWRDMTAFANSTADDRLMRAIATATTGDNRE